MWAAHPGRQTVRRGSPTTLLRRANRVPRRIAVTGVPKTDGADLRAFPDDPSRRSVECPEAVWTVTTHGELPDEYEQRMYDTSAEAWNDYAGRILELEIHGFARDGEEAAQYGRRWVSVFLRGVERMSVAIERT